MDGDGRRRGTEPVVVEGADATTRASRRSLQVVPLTLNPISQVLLGFTQINPNQSEVNRLCSRFLLNVPKEELESFERILFLLEQAHWFYEDNSVEHNPNLKSLSFKDFTSLSKSASA